MGSFLKNVYGGVELSLFLKYLHYSLLCTLFIDSDFVTIMVWMTRT